MLLIQKLLCLILSLASCTLLTIQHTARASRCIEIRKEAVVGIENDSVRVLFDHRTGSLVSLKNLQTNDEYLKKLRRGGNLFRAFLDTTAMPYLGACEHSSDYGGMIIEPDDCTLRSAMFSETGQSIVLKMVLDHAASKIIFRLKIEMLHDGDRFDCSLEAECTGAGTHTVRMAFPYLSGLCLGENQDTNVGIAMYDRGIPGEPAWINSGGVYGRDVAMQWQCVNEPARDEGFAMIAMDPEIRNKIVGRFPNGMLTFYFDSLPVTSGSKVSWPAARILVFRGGWRVAAKGYGDWFTSEMNAREIPAWFMKEVSICDSNWLPPPNINGHEVTNKFVQKTGVPSFRDILPNSYLGTFADLSEHAMWNDGIRQRPDTYGPWMSSGFGDFRQDLGGRQAFSEGVDACHKIGRRVAMYVAGYGTRKNGSLVANGNWRDWAIMDRGGKVETGGYQGGFFACHGYKPWQDNLVRVCRMLAAAGVDSIRLDELGVSFRPCFNPAHKHASPYNANHWTLKLLRRVREVVDPINPDLLLTTENSSDFFHRYTNGALVMHCAGKEIDAMRAALPTYLPIAYHPGAAESAITGGIQKRITARRRHWPVAWPYILVPNAWAPFWRPDGSGPELRWHELQPTFAEAVCYGEPTVTDPVAEADRKWRGHLWKSKRFWVLVGGYDDGAPLAGPLKIKLPKIPEDVRHAIEFDVATREFAEIPLNRDAAGDFIEVHHGLSAVLLPRPNCPPMITLRNKVETIRANDTKTFNIVPYSPWRDDTLNIHANFEAPCFIASPVAVRLPATVSLSAPAHLSAGHYYFRITGNVLPYKGWIHCSAPQTNKIER